MTSDPCRDLLLAIRYIDGELSGDEHSAFENRLAQDQGAREAVAEAVELSLCVARLSDASCDVRPLARVRRSGIQIHWKVLAAAACLFLALGLALLAGRRPLPVPSQVHVAAVPGRSAEVAIAWSGLRQTGEVDLISRTELLAWLDDSSASPSSDLVGPGVSEGEGGEDGSLSPWLLEVTRLHQPSSPTRSGLGEN